MASASKSQQALQLELLVKRDLEKAQSWDWFTDSMTFNKDQFWLMDKTLPSLKFQISEATLLLSLRTVFFSMTTFFTILLTVAWIMILTSKTGLTTLVNRKIWLEKSSLVLRDHKSTNSWWVKIGGTIPKSVKEASNCQVEKNRELLSLEPFWNLRQLCVSMRRLLP